MDFSDKTEEDAYKKREDSVAYKMYIRIIESII